MQTCCQRRHERYVDADMNTPDKVNEYLSKVALGDRDAFRRLYDATSPKLFGLCLRILRERSEAEDALQEIYVKIWRAAPTYATDRINPMAWLVAIARNHAIDRLRTRKPEARDIDTMVDLSDKAPDPEQSSIAASERRRIETCIEELDTDHGRAVRGAYLDGYSYQELADRHGIPLNTMRTWLRRSLMKLKECLER